MGVVRAFVSMPKRPGENAFSLVVKDNFFFAYFIIFDSPNKAYQGKRPNGLKTDYAFNARVSSWSTS